MGLSTRNQRTLKAVFTEPCPTDIRWAEVERLLKAAGATVEERAGSRVAVKIERRVHILHKPHPRPVMPLGTVRNVRRILQDAGITP
jgi:hypothetical protein